MENTPLPELDPPSRELDKIAVILKMTREYGIRFRRCKEFSFPLREPGWSCIATNADGNRWVFWKWCEEGESKVKCFSL